MATVNGIDRIAKLAALGEMLVASVIDSGLATKKVAHRRRKATNGRRASKLAAEPPAKLAKTKGKKYDPATVAKGDE